MAFKGKTIGVISIKGGVGKTSCALNLAAAFANEFDKKTLVVDANYSAPNLGLHMGIVQPKITIHDVFKNNYRIQSAIHKHDENLHVVPGSLIGRRVNPFQLKEKLNSAKYDYDAIVIDSSPNLNDEMLSTILASDELLVVSTPDLPTLSCTIHAIKVAKKRKTPISGIILNKVRNKKYELSIDEIEKASEVPVVAVFADNAQMLEALALTTPIVMHRPMSDLSVGYKKLAASLIGKDYSDPRLMHKIKDAFAFNKSKDEINRTFLKYERS